MGCCRPAAPVSVTVATSASVGGIPVSRFFTLRTAVRADAASKGVGITVTPPASTDAPPEPEPLPVPPPVPLPELFPEPLPELLPVPLEVDREPGAVVHAPTPIPIRPT